MATPFGVMATPAPAVLPALAAASCATGTAAQGLPGGGWVPRNSIVRDALQVSLCHTICSSAFSKLGCNTILELVLSTGGVHNVVLISNGPQGFKTLSFAIVGSEQLPQHGAG